MCKRYYSMKSIKIVAASSEYDAFEKYMLKCEAAVYESDGSSTFREKFIFSSKEEMIKMYEDLRRQ